MRRCGLRMTRCLFPNDGAARSIAPGGSFVSLLPCFLASLIKEADGCPGIRTSWQGVRKIAARFGVAVGTVQRISRPFEGCIESVSEGGYRRRVNELQKRITRSVPSVSRPSGDLAQQALISRVAGHVYGASSPRPPLGVGSQNEAHVPKFPPPSCPPQGFSRVARSWVGSIAVRAIDRPQRECSNWQPRN